MRLKNMAFTGIHMLLYSILCATAPVFASECDKDYYHYKGYFHFVLDVNEVSSGLDFWNWGLWQKVTVKVSTDKWPAGTWTCMRLKENDEFKCYDKSGQSITVFWKPGVSQSEACSIFAEAWNSPH